MKDRNGEAGATGAWRKTLDDLAERRRVARAMGGADRIQRHHAKGRLDARARIDYLLDNGSFRELGTLVGDVPADAFVAGAGTIDNRPVLVGAEDFTTVAGTIGAGSNAKRYRIAELAFQERVPLVMLLEGAGFRPSGGGHGGRSPTDLVMQARCSGHVPMVTAVLGASAGHGALVAPMSDFTVMTRSASIFTAGPPVVAEATGEAVDKEELGGPSVAVPSGLVHAVAEDDEDALDQVAHYLAYFPSSAWSYPPNADTGDTGERETPELLDIIPRDNRSAYDMREALSVIVDDESWFEVQAGFGPSMICALAHLGGQPVALVANQPLVIAGAIDASAADKAAHFITVADSFHLPIVFISDNPGMLPGTASERAGVLRSGARMYAAQTLADTAKLHVTFRKAYGFGSMVMSMGAFEGQTVTFGFPGSTMGAMSANANSRAMKAEEEEAARLREIELQASYSSAGRLGFDELIDPRETRNALLGALRLSNARRQVSAAPVARIAITP